MRCSTLIFGLILLAGVSPAPAAMPKITCGQLMANLEAPLTAGDGSPLFGAGKTYEEEFLAGEAAGALNSARRDRIKLLTQNPELAAAAARRLNQRGFGAYQSPGEVLLSLDVLAKVNPDLFVSAATGVLKWPLPASRDAAKLPAFKRQLASRLVGSLNTFGGARSLRVTELLARSPWLREFFAGEVNAGRTLLTAMKGVPDALGADPALKAKLASLNVLANEWIQPRRIFAREKKGAALSSLPEMDWAFSRVIAEEMSRLLAASDPIGAKGYAATAAELRLASGAPEYLKNERVRALFSEFNLPD